MPTRRAVWIVRLVFYPLAIGLIALAWHQRQAGADDVAPARDALPQLGGLTAEGEAVSARLTRDGEPFALNLPVHFRCTPRGIADNDFWVTYWSQRADGAHDRVGGGRLVLHHRGIATTWDDGWSGTSDLDVDARYAGTRLTGTIRARLRLRVQGAARARCVTDAVAFSMTPREPPRVVRTSQSGPASLALEGDDVRALAVRYLANCNDGRSRATTWSVRLAPGEATLRPGGRIAIERRWHPVIQPRRVVVGPAITGAGGAISTLELADDGAGRIRGRLGQSMNSQPDGLACGASVTFTVPRERGD